MVSIEQFNRIKECKDFGLSMNKTAKKLDLSYKAVTSWWNKSEEEFFEIQNKNEYMMDTYRQYIVDLLRVCPQINDTTVYYRLDDEFDDFDVAKPTFFRYMKRLRSETGLAKPKRKCDYYRETEPGYEAQADFGQYKMKNMYGGHTTVYFFVMILSYSRMRFTYFSLQPFTAKAVCDAHDYAFRYFGGRTQTVMYDNDKVFVASESIGNIILVKEFEDYVVERGFSTVFCHTYDPSTKGKVESSVCVIKQSFLDGRIFCGIDRLNMECLDWLDKVINNTPNDRTKELPSIRYKNEYRFLQKVYFGRNKSTIATLKNGRYVLYKDNYYQIPENTLEPNARIRLEVQDNMLLMYSAENNDMIFKTNIVTGTGLVVNTFGKDNKSYPKSYPIEMNLVKTFAHNEKLSIFINELRKQKSRYFFEQCRRIVQLTQVYNNEEILEGIDYCLDVNKCCAYELTCFLYMQYGEEKGEKAVKRYMNSKYRRRAMHIREEIKNA